MKRRAILASSVLVALLLALTGCGAESLFGIKPFGLYDGVNSLADDLAFGELGEVVYESRTGKGHLAGDPTYELVVKGPDLQPAAESILQNAGFEVIGDINDWSNWDRSVEGVTQTVAVRTIAASEPIRLLQSVGTTEKTFPNEVLVIMISMPPDS